MPRQYEFRIWTTLRGREPPRDVRRGRRRRQGGAALSRDRGQDRKTVADADCGNYKRQSQSDMDRPVIDLENRNLGAYAERSELSLPHAYAPPRCARPSARPAVP